MPIPSEGSPDREALRLQIVGLGRQSVRKHYYGQLQDRVEELHRFRFLLDQSSELIILFDPNSGELVDANETAVQRLAKDRETMRGLRIRDIVLHETGDLPLELGRTSGDGYGAPGSLTAQLRAHDGSRFVADRTISYRKFRDREYGVLSARDATERVRAERRQRELSEAVRHTKELLERVIESTPDLVFVKDRELRYRLVNHSFAELMKRPVEDIIGRTDEEIGFPPKIGLGDALGQNTAWKDGEAVVLSGKRVMDELTLVRPPNTRLVFASVRVPLLGPKGEAASGIVGIARDVTDLVRAREAAVSANQAKSAFLATMSHEIRTPMNAILGYADLLEMTTTLSEDQRDYLEIIRRSGSTLLELINSVLDYSRIEFGSLQIESRAMDPLQVVRESVEALSVRAKEKRLDMVLQSQAGCPRVLSDPLRVKQVMLNLLGNAVKFTQSGSVTVSFGYTRPRAGLVELHIAVRDTGIGLSDAQQKLLFKPFQQFYLSPDAPMEGSGLGLAISYRLVQNMGGRLWCESEIDKGSVFHVTMPVREAAASVEAEPVQQVPIPSAPPSRNLHVLAVDDNAINLRLLVTILRKLGCTSKSAQSGEEALEILRNEHFDLGIFDVLMPGMDGTTLMRHVRAGEAGPGAAHMKIAALTALAMPGDEEKCLQAGADFYMKKPIKVDELKAVLDASSRAGAHA